MTGTQIDGREARIVTCSHCGHDETVVVFARHGFAWQRCAHCGLVRVNPQLTQQAIGEIYRAGYTDKRRTIAGGEQVLPFHRSVLDGLAGIVGAPGRILDVGCFEGRFLRDARELGWDPVGTEISEQAVQFARTERGLDVRSGVLEGQSFAASSFDAVVLLDVIEHLPDPRRTLEEVSRILRPGGALYLWTPNFDCAARLAAGARWGAVIFPWHLYYFTPVTLQRMLHETGFHTARIESRNWLLDFRDRYGPLQRGRAIADQPKLVRRFRRVLDIVSAPVFGWLDRHGRHWGAQMGLFATRGDES